jgi:cyanophycinase
VTGVLALVGGAEFTEVCDDLDRALLEASGGRDVLVVPTAAAFEHPDRAVARAVAHFERLGARATGLNVLGRPDTAVVEHVDAVRSSRFTYLAGGSPLHLRAVLKETPLWDALVSSHAGGAVLAGASAGAMVLTDPMVDPRGGAFTLGLGLVGPLAVAPHVDEWSHDQLKRTIDLARGITLVTLERGAAVVRGRDGRWTAHGAVQVYVRGEPASIDALPAG